MLSRNDQLLNLLPARNYHAIKRFLREDADEAIIVHKVMQSGKTLLQHVIDTMDLRIVLAFCKYTAGFGWGAIIDFDPIKHFCTVMTGPLTAEKKKILIALLDRGIFLIKSTMEGSVNLHNASKDLKKVVYCEALLRGLETQNIKYLFGDGQIKVDDLKEFLKFRKEILGQRRRIDAAQLEKIHVFLKAQDAHCMPDQKVQAIYHLLHKHAVCEWDKVKITDKNLQIVMDQRANGSHARRDKKSSTQHLTPKFSLDEIAAMLQYHRHQFDAPVTNQTLAFDMVLPREENETEVAYILRKAKRVDGYDPKVIMPYLQSDEALKDMVASPGIMSIIQEIAGLPKCSTYSPYINQAEKLLRREQLLTDRERLVLRSVGYVEEVVAELKGKEAEDAPTETVSDQETIAELKRSYQAEIANLRQEMTDKFDELKRLLLTQQQPVKTMRTPIGLFDDTSNCERQTRKSSDF